MSSSSSDLTLACSWSGFTMCRINKLTNGVLCQFKWSCSPVRAVENFFFSKLRKWTSQLTHWVHRLAGCSSRQLSVNISRHVPLAYVTWMLINILPALSKQNQTSLAFKQDKAPIRRLIFNSLLTGLVDGRCRVKPHLLLLHWRNCNQPASTLNFRFLLSESMREEEDGFTMRDLRGLYDGRSGKWKVHMHLQTLPMAQPARTRSLDSALETQRLFLRQRDKLTSSQRR